MALKPLKLLETWEASADHVTSMDVSYGQVVDIARLIGWMQPTLGSPQ